MLEVLERIVAGEGKLEDLEEIRRLAQGLEKGSLCALGQLAPAPVMSTLQHFEDEYRQHIEEGRCPAGKCSALIRFEIIADLCTGCTVCALNCPSSAISGERRQPHILDQALCVQCGLCKVVCKFDAIEVY
jgi:ferredoxin